MLRGSPLGGEWSCVAPEPRCLKYHSCHEAWRGLMLRFGLLICVCLFSLGCALLFAFGSAGSPCFFITRLRYLGVLKQFEEVSRCRTIRWPAPTLRANAASPSYGILTSIGDMRGSGSVASKHMGIGRQSLVERHMSADVHDCSRMYCISSCIIL